MYTGALSLCVHSLRKRIRDFTTLNTRDPLRKHCLRLTSMTHQGLLALKGHWQVPPPRHWQSTSLQLRRILIKGGRGWQLAATSGSWWLLAAEGIHRWGRDGARSSNNARVGANWGWWDGGCRHNGDCCCRFGRCFSCSGCCGFQLCCSHSRLCCCFVCFCCCLR